MTTRVPIPIYMNPPFRGRADTLPAESTTETRFSRLTSGRRLARAHGVCVTSGRGMLGSLLALMPSPVVLKTTGDAALEGTMDVNDA